MDTGPCFWGVVDFDRDWNNVEKGTTPRCLKMAGSGNQRVSPRIIE